MSLFKEPLEDKVGSDDHDRIVSLFREQCKPKFDHFVLSVHDFVFDELFDPVCEVCLNFAEAWLDSLGHLSPAIDEEVGVFERIENTFVQTLRVLDEFRHSEPIFLQLVQGLSIHTDISCFLLTS